MKSRHARLQEAIFCRSRRLLTHAASCRTSVMVWRDGRPVSSAAQRLETLLGVACYRRNRTGRRTAPGCQTPPSHRLMPPLRMRVPASKVHRRTLGAGHHQELSQTRRGPKPQHARDREGVRRTRPVPESDARARPCRLRKFPNSDRFPHVDDWLELRHRCTVSLLDPGAMNHVPLSRCMISSRRVASIARVSLCWC